MYKRQVYYILQEYGCEDLLVWCAVVSHFAAIAVYTAVVLIQQYYHDKQVYTSCNVAYTMTREWIVENGLHQLNVNYCIRIIPARVTCLSTSIPEV